ncbi:Beta-monoglucosyldiacylglycerol synthase [Gimesia alba]|uniref:Beta-monoglucosyldiacylglycerol synthase n=1 Tax=Gimesia alba TaxID=2527973 RepID=A0A517RGV6_9PLAN|nr:Beta-monoglucosyldiacylglycerol synthase [Gimesia alba]
MIIYAYAGYPLILWFLTRRRETQPEDTKTSSNSPLPRVSIVIAAYKEETVILERLNNLAKLDYPSDRLEILIGCDGNEDLTGELEGISKPF